MDENCVNKRGTYRCEKKCRSGYRFDGRTCVGKSNFYKRINVTYGGMAPYVVMLVKINK